MKGDNNINVDIKYKDVSVTLMHDEDNKPYFVVD